MKNKERSIFKPVSIPIYRSTTFIAINLSDEQLKENLEKHIDSKKTVKRLMKHSDLEDHQGITFFDGGYSVVRYGSLEDAQDINIIAHESFHVACSIMRYISLDFSEDSEEAFAYLLGYITEQYQDIISLDLEANN